MALDSGKKGGGLEQLDKKLDQKLRLNPKASEFKPIGLRSQAPAFVPRGFGVGATINKTQPPPPPPPPATTQPVSISLSIKPSTAPNTASDANSNSNSNPNEAATATATVEPKVVPTPTVTAVPAPKAAAAPAPATTSTPPAASAPTPASAPASTSAAVVVPETPQLSTEEEEQLLNAHFKEHFNVIFIGHVDAGKSTLGGNILFLTGMVDKRTMEKYEREAKDAGRESWYLSWALDTNSEERAKGKTVECGRAFFETEKRRYTILDAPGHKNFVPSMLGGAAQADVGVLVISARRGEFETGFDRGGQTREHAILAKTSGVRQLIVVINKMDDPTVQWDQGRYADILAKLTPFLRTAGYNPKTDLIFLPVSGYTGANVKDRLAAGVAPWYSGPSLLEVLDGLTAVDRKVNAPLRMPISDKFKDMGTVVGGKIESGFVKIGQKLVIMPNKRNCEVSAIFGEDDGEIESAICGDNVRIRLRGVEEEDISLGNVLSDPKNPCSTAVHFDAQLFILDAKNIIAPGYTSVLHVHNLVEEVSIVRFLHLLDKKNPNKKSRVPPTFVKRGQSCIATLTSSANADAFISNSTSTSASAPSSAPSSNSTSANSTGVICVERFKDYPQLGRFTLRDEGKTIAIGKIIKLH